MCGGERSGGSSNAKDYSQGNSVLRKCIFLLLLSKCFSLRCNQMYVLFLKLYIDKDNFSFDIHPLIFQIK